MAITYDQQHRLFRLDNEFLTYAFAVLGEGRLVHLYYGAPLPEDETTAVSLFAEMGYVAWHSSNDPGWKDVNDPQFSPNINMLEYPTQGNGDFRPAALAVEDGEGTDTTDLRYVTHRIFPGKKSPAAMPALHLANEEEADTLEVVMADAHSGIEVTLVYTLFRHHPVIARHNSIGNKGAAAVYVDKMASATISLPTADYDILHLGGHYIRENCPLRDPMPHGIFRIASTRGESGHWNNPFQALVAKDVTEEAGDVYATALVWSGSFALETERNFHETVRVNVGVDAETFRWYLTPGETFTTPEAVLLYTNSGIGEMSRAFHRLWMQHLLRGAWKDVPRPLLINSWEAAFFDFNETKLLDFARSASELGIEMLVMDDGWFSRRSDDTTSLGDWWVNEDKLKGGLRKLVDGVHALGMKFGIWFEPEMVSPDSDLYRAHPDWCLHHPATDRTNCRQQLLLDMSRPEVRDCIFEQMSAVLDGSGVDYIKWDFNRPMTEVYSAALPKERQKEARFRSMLGSYDLLDRITRRYPDILLETCASGGGRFDAGMLYYSTQIWASDNTDGHDRVAIQFGTTLCYPPSSMGSHISENPRTNFSFKGKVAMWGTFGYELDPRKISEEEKELVRSQVAEYHKTHMLLRHGELYRLISPWESQERNALITVSPDKRQAVLFAYMLCRPVVAKYLLRLRGLDVQRRYLEEETGKIYTGAFLMNVGINLSATDENYWDHSALSRHYTAID